MCSTTSGTTPTPTPTPAGRSFAELADAPVDGEWLTELVRLLPARPADGPEAAAALRAVARAETLLAAARIRLTDEVAFRADVRNMELLHELTDGEADPAKLPPSTATLEVATALRVTSGAARYQIEQARLIHGLPGITSGKLARGETSLAHVRKLLELARNEETLMLLGECEQLIWRAADNHPDWTPPQLKRAAARIMSAHRPADFARDHLACREDSDVTIEAEPDTGMAWLHAYLPMLDAVTIKTGVDAAAAAARAAGDRRPTGMLRAEALAGCVEAYLTGTPVADGQTGPAGAGVQPELPGRPRSHGRPVEIQVVAPLGTVLGLVDLPGELPGNGLIPADVVRDLAREAKLRLVTYDPATGTLLDYGQTTYRPPAALAAKVASTWQTSAGIGSNRPAIRCDLDHLDPYGRGGPTSDGNLIPLDRRNHRIRTHDPALSAARDPASGRLTWTTPFGQTVETYPYDWRLGP